MASVNYKLVIAAAGLGSRLGGETKYLPKALVSVNNRPAISYIIEKFPKDVEIVIAVGYHGDLIKQYCKLAYTDRKITFVDVDPYAGEGSGLGLSLKLCKDHLQCPFIFSSCDTIIQEAMPVLDCNWVGYDFRENYEQYRTLTLNENNVITCINEKNNPNKTQKCRPYIGLAGIVDYEEFWNAMTDECIPIGEVFGIRALKNVKAYKFTWFDIGQKIELEATRARYNKADGPNILPKENETIWFLEDKVIKYSDNEGFIRDRVNRVPILEGFVPQIIDSTKNMYSYGYANGKVMSKVSHLPIFKKLLNFSKDFWQPYNLDAEQRKDFDKTCMKFYKTKTLERVQIFYNTYNKSDNAEYINGVQYPSLQSMLDVLNWDKIADGIPGRFHGDFHFENILYDEESDKFNFLDWRQNFGGNLTVGDCYYDLAKLNHGLIVCHELIAKNMFDAKWENNKIDFELTRKQSLVDCEEYYYKWLDANGYDSKKVKCLTALIYLNICGLHEYPYCHLLYGLGKKMLYENMVI